MYAFFGFLKRLWMAMGMPCEHTVRNIRHGWLGNLWPSQEQRVQPSTMTIVHRPHPKKSDVAVVITCHNYADYLPKAIASILAQTVQPSDILLVDDASSDETRECTERFADQGVRYLRVEHGNVSKTRNSGAEVTSCTFLLFLDADDTLRADYIEESLKQMTGPEVAIVYHDRQNVGENKHYIKTPEYHYASLTESNYISSHALIRRQAFDLVGGYRELRYGLEDWDFYRRVLRLPFIAKRGNSLIYYNVHKDSMLQTLIRNTHQSYANDAAIAQHPLTIFTPFAGRADVLDRYVEGLRSLEWDPTMIRLHWYDTSGNAAFEERLRDTMKTLRFGQVTYTNAPLPALWKRTPQTLIEERIREADTTEYYYELAVARAYNEMITQCSTEYMLTLEDDIRLQPDTLKLLSDCMDRDVAAVIAPYLCGFYPRTVVWHLNEKHEQETFKTFGTGTQQVDGSGFGCTLFRLSMLRKVAPIVTGVKNTPKQWYDQMTYLRLAHHGKILCNWDAKVEHMQTERYAEKLYPSFT